MLLTYHSLLTQKALLRRNTDMRNFMLFSTLSLRVCSSKLFFCADMIYLAAFETHLACELLISVKMNLISP